MMLVVLVAAAVLLAGASNASAIERLQAAGKVASGASGADAHAPAFDMAAVMDAARARRASRSANRNARVAAATAAAAGTRTAVLLDTPPATATATTTTTTTTTQALRTTTTAVASDDVDVQRKRERRALVAVVVPVDATTTPLEALAVVPRVLEQQHADFDVQVIVVHSVEAAACVREAQLRELYADYDDIKHVLTYRCVERPLTAPQARALGAFKYAGDARMVAMWDAHTWYAADRLHAQYADVVTSTAGDVAASVYKHALVARVEHASAVAAAAGVRLYEAANLDALHYGSLAWRAPLPHSVASFGVARTAHRVMSADQALYERVRDAPHSRVTVHDETVVYVLPAGATADARRVAADGAADARTAQRRLTRALSLATSLPATGTPVPLARAPRFFTADAATVVGAALLSRAQRAAKRDVSVVSNTRPDDAALEEVLQAINDAGDAARAHVDMLADTFQTDAAAAAAATKQFVADAFAAVGASLEGDLTAELKSAIDAVFTTLAATSAERKALLSASVMDVGERQRSALASLAADIEALATANATATRDFLAERLSDELAPAIEAQLELLNSNSAQTLEAQAEIDAALPPIAQLGEDATEARDDVASVQKALFKNSRSAVGDARSALVTKLNAIGTQCEQRNAAISEALREIRERVKSTSTRIENNLDDLRNLYTSSSTSGSDSSS